jgi:threonine aldolase
LAVVRRGYQFASDNTAGVCPEAMEAIIEANADAVAGYGGDQWTLRASNQLRQLFEIDCEVFFCFNGTAANSMAIAHLCRSYHSVICHESAHIETDECGGPEFFSHGTKVLLAQGEAGKLSPESVEFLVNRRKDIHYPKPRVLSVTQSTELGSVYSIAELDRLAAVAHRHDLKIHMDGARFANAIATLGVKPSECTWKAGVDVLCFGGTKNGMPVGEAVVFFDRALAHEFDFRCKQAGQLASKMRFLAAPWVRMIESGAWLRHAAHANACAKRLHDVLKRHNRITIKHTPQANAVFAVFPDDILQGLRERGWVFYSHIGGASRLMCNWQTREADIELLAADLGLGTPG